ncbi:hypothetical protein E6H31_04365 [Candidatus Bathyarchaeota archaeon]|nr:MAG: hypothetical protein E6H31_04365 [Candidatus Bathyarchaeota archaeon]
MADLDLAAVNVTRAGTLLGSTIAVFTFLLFSLYPRFSSGSIDPVLFQITLTIVVPTILSFSLSGLFSYRIGVLKMNSTKKRASMRGAALFWLIRHTLCSIGASSNLVHGRTYNCRDYGSGCMGRVYSLHSSRRQRVWGFVRFYLMPD